MSESLWKNSVVGHIDELDDDEDEFEVPEVNLDLKHFHVVLSVPAFGVLVGWALIGVAATIGKGISLLRK